MKIIALQGLMGGTGNTSLVAGLAFALNYLGQSVLVMDLCPTNFLGLQFNMPINHVNGWANDFVERGEMAQAAMRYMPGMDFLPFGEVEHSKTLKQALDNNPDYFKKLLSQLKKKNDYQWLLLDVAHSNSYLNSNDFEMMDSHIITANPNMNCHLRLSQLSFTHNTYYLINQFNPTYTIEHDLKLLWSKTMDSLLPLTIHQDVSVAEAQALKMPVNMAYPDSMASHDIRALAHWLMDYEHTGSKL